MPPDDRVAALQEKLQQELTRLADFSAAQADPCLAAQVIALRDETVRVMLLERLVAGAVLQRAVCLGATGVWFDITSPPDEVSVGTPSFLVQVAPHVQSVHRIVEPFELQEVVALRTAALAGTAAVAETRTQTEDVEIAFEGELNDADVHVEGQPITIGLAQKGAGSVELTGPTIDVGLDLRTGSFVKPVMSLSIRGVTKKRTLAPKNRRFTGTVTFTCSEFGL